MLKSTNYFNNKEIIILLYWNNKILNTLIFGPFGRKRSAYMFFCRRSSMT